MVNRVVVALCHSECVCVCWVGGGGGKKEKECYSKGQKKWTQQFSNFLTSTSLETEKTFTLLCGVSPTLKGGGQLYEW